MQCIYLYGPVAKCRDGRVTDWTRWELNRNGRYPLIKYGHNETDGKDDDKEWRPRKGGGNVGKNEEGAAVESSKGGQ